MVAKARGPSTGPNPVSKTLSAGFFGFDHPGLLEHLSGVLQIAIPAAVIVLCSVGFALWTRARVSRRVAQALRDLTAGLGREAELASSLEPAEVTARVLAAAAALPGADAALLILDGRAEAVGLTDQEAERAALETPRNTNLRSMQVAYRYRIDEVDGGGNLARAALVVPLRTGDGTIGSLSAVTRSNPPAFPDEAADALEALGLRAGPALGNAQRFVEATRISELDPLTGLGNRRLFHQLLAREVARSRRYGRRLSLIVLDLDDFKRVNDRLGHLAGDEVLAEVANRMRTCIRSTDVGCRVGGDEFAVILPESNRGDADHLAARIERAVGSEPIAKAGTLKISAGVAELSPDDTPNDLFERADEDLYRAKAATKRDRARDSA
jgi:diguanylate cyclase (GGDEF)-like protein